MVERRAEQELVIASQGRGRNWAIHIPGKRFVEELRPTAVLAAAGAYAVTDPVDVFKSRKLHLYVDVVANDAGNIVSIIPEVSMDKSGADDTFFVPAVNDGTIAASTLGVDPVAEYSVHNFGAVTFTPLEIVTPAAVGATDHLRMVLTLDVSNAYWIRFRVAEDGSLGTPADLGLSFSKST